MIWLLIALLIYTSIKMFGYYCTTCGLMYYIATNHKDELSEEKLKEITYQSTKRVIYDFFHRNQN